MTAAEIAAKLELVQALLLELLPAAQALREQADERVTKLGRATNAWRKYGETDWGRWRAMRAEPEMAKHSKRRAAALIAGREGLPEAAVDSIRRVI